jgi:cell division septation protein DedD
VATARKKKKANVRRPRAQAARKTSRPRGRGKRKLPNWTLLVLGLAIGVVVVVSTQWVIRRAHTPGTGLHNLFTRAPAPPSQPVAHHPSAKPLPKPTYDFYTILPETETVIPDREWNDLKHKPEKGAQYVLQAASYNNFQQADHLKARLALNGLESTIQKVTVGDKGTFYRVRLGPFSNADNADEVNRKLTALGVKALRLRVKKGT